MTVRSFWFLYWNGKPTLSPATETSTLLPWSDDVCGSNGITECLETIIFREYRSKPSDLLVANVGIIYALTDPMGIQDLSSWRKNEFRAFIRAVDLHFNGTIVWMTQSKHMADWNKPRTVKENPWYLYQDKRYQELDKEIVPIVLEETNWTIYDGYHITEPLAYNHDYFADGIHHPGRLTHLGWQFILGNYCPTAPPVYE